MTSHAAILFSRSQLAMNKLFLGFGLLAAACGDNAQSDHVPSASLTPHTRSDTTSTVACGDDVALYNDATPDLRYAYTYDSGGRLTHLEGVYTAGGADDSIDYTWDNQDRFTHMLETNSWGYRVEIGEAYDGDNLTSYTYATTGTDYNDAWSYTYSDYLGAWQPQHELVGEQGQTPINYNLAYDNFGRLISATSDSDSVTYTYDDTAGTITSNTDNGAWVDTTTYGPDWTELSDVWDGSDPSTIAGKYSLVWDGDALVSETYSSGSQDAPKTLETVETDTMRYDCSAARKTQRALSFHAHAPRVKLTL
jgi:hypothetical protein